jgi:hypothetical protein
MVLINPMGDGIETDHPFPLVNIMGHTSAFSDRADVDVVVVDLPGFLVSIGFAAASEIRPGFVGPGWKSRHAI